jgi:hypothetical protein
LFDEVSQFLKPSLKVDNEHLVAEFSLLLKPSIEDEHAAMQAVADDQNIAADDKQITGYEKIIDESEDARPFGIMSVYCNSEIHSRYIFF